MKGRRRLMFGGHVVVSLCIDNRGQVVANGTPEQLKQKSDIAGAVLVRVAGVPASELKDRLAQVSAGRKVMIVTEANGVVTARVYPKGGVNGELARGISELAQAQRWQLQELHTEEGRLDEVFRGITLPETVKSQEERK